MQAARQPLLVRVVVQPQRAVRLQLPGDRPQLPEDRRQPEDRRRLPEVRPQVPAQRARGPVAAVLLRAAARLPQAVGLAEEAEVRAAADVAG